MAIEEEKRLGPFTTELVTEEQSQLRGETPVRSRPGSRSTGTAQQALPSLMLEVREGILDKVRGICNALEGQTAALLNINETLLGLTNILKTIYKP